MTRENFTSDFSMPENMKKWIRCHDGVNLSVNWNAASADCGYAHHLFKSVVLSMLTRTCHRCGFDEVWNPDDSQSKCQRHSYNAWRYDEVFVWADEDNNISLDEAFERWKEANPRESAADCLKPVKFMSFGQLNFK